MELIDNDFTNPNEVTQISSSHFYLHHHHSQLNHPFMIIPTPVSYLPSSSFNQPLTALSTELCHKKPDDKVRDNSDNQCKKQKLLFPLLKCFVLQSGGRKRKRGNDEGAEEGRVNFNSSDVIHVRVKRGQATDSHSLAERVLVIILHLVIRYLDMMYIYYSFMFVVQLRRKKINEKLQSLHDIVPGCHKVAILFIHNL